MRSEVRQLKTDQSDEPLAGSDKHCDLFAAVFENQRGQRGTQKSGTTSQSGHDEP